MTVEIIPITDHEHYSVNGHELIKDSSGNYRCMTRMSVKELIAFNCYRKLVFNNHRFKRHPKSTFKTH